MPIRSKANYFLAVAAMELPGASASAKIQML